MARRNPKIPAADLREVKRLSSLLWSQGGSTQGVDLGPEEAE